MAPVLAVLPVAVSPLTVDPSVTPDDGGSPGFLGFVFTFALAVVLILLALSLARQLRKVNRNAPPDEPPAEPEAPASTTSEQLGGRAPTSSDVAEGEDDDEPGGRPA